MIERLITNLRALIELPAGDMPSEPGRRIAADCADAIRLELDCPQQELTAHQRALLSALGDLLESEAAMPVVREAAVAASRALG